MSDNFWRRLSYIFGLLPIGALFGLAAYVANIEVQDLDLWLHLAMGKFISLHYDVPDMDMLSFSIAGTPWNNHEWLFQVIIYQIYNAWGPGGLLTMQIGIVILTMLLLLFLGYNRDRQLFVSVVLLLTCLIYQQRFTLRPDLYSLLFFTLFIYILALHIDKKWAVPGLFIIQVLWTNMHGFFFFGPLFVLIGLVSEWIKRYVPLPYEWNESGRLTDQEFKRLQISFILVIGACFLNPHFADGALYPIMTFFSLSGENKIFFKYIQELQKPITWGNITNEGRFIYYKVMIILSAISFVFNRRRIDISALFFWLVFLIFSLQAVRNAAFFAFAGYLVIITNAINLSMRDIVPIRFTVKKFQYMTSIFFKICLLFWIMQYSAGMSARSYYDFDNYQLKSEFGGVALRTYPNKGADFLIENNVKGNFFNDFNSGAYLLGRCYPNVKVFIDGRTEAYGGKFFKKYQKIWKGDSALFEKTANELNITGAFLNTAKAHIPRDILNYFYKDEEWVLVYFDYDALIFLRDIEQNKEMIDRFAIDLAQWTPPETDFLKLGSASVKPYHHYNRAFALESLGFDDQALLEAQEALRIKPNYSSVYTILGKIYGKRKDYTNAFENYRIAAAISNHNMDIRLNLALAYYDLNEYDGAINQYLEIIESWPNAPEAYFFVSRVYAKDRQYDQMLKYLNYGNRLNSENVIDLLEIADIIFGQQEFQAAEDVLNLALNTKKELEKVYKRLGVLYQSQNEFDRARESFQNALSIKGIGKDFKEDVEELLEKLEDQQS